MSTQDYAAFTPEFWSKRIQVTLRKILISRFIASFEERATLRQGDKVHRPRYTIGNPVDYVKSTGYTEYSGVTTTDQFLEIDTAKVLPIFISREDIIQNKYDTAIELANQGAYKLRREIDAAVFNEYDNAFATIDDGDIGGTAGNPITMSTTNFIKTLTMGKAKLLGNNVEDDRAWSWVVDPITVAHMEQYLPTIGFQQSDREISKGLWNGMVAHKWGLDIYQSNNLTWTGSLNFGSNPTDGDTVTINSVIYTFKATPALAGAVDIGGSTAVSIDNLVLAINGGAVGSAYIALSAADRLRMYNITATDGTTKMTLEAVGNSIVNCSETLTAGADIFSLKETHTLMMRNGAIDQVIQDEVNVVTIENPVNVESLATRLGRDMVPNTMYGTKTFYEGAQRMLDVQVANG